MAYSPPSLKVYQEFVPQPAGNTLPLYACIIAPQYKLHRFTVEDERASLGAYSQSAGNTFTSWPDKTAGSEVDVVGSSLWLKDAILEYHSFTLSGTDKDPGTEVSWDGLLTDGGNRIRSEALVFRTANGTARSAVYDERDVALGDYIKVAYGAHTVETTVSGVIEEDDEATVAALRTSSSNQAAIGAASASVTENIASSNYAVTASAAAYDGIADGDATDVYTVTVISTDGTLDATAASVVSASGNDDVTSVTLKSSGVATACGARGATFTLTADPSLASSSSESSASSSSSDSSSSSSPSSSSASSRSSSSESSSSGSSSSSSESSSSSSQSSESSSSSSLSSSSPSSSSQSSSSPSSSSTSDSSSSNVDRQLVVGDYWTVTVAQAYVLPTPVPGGIYTGTQDTTYLATVSQGGAIGTDTVKIQPSTTNGYDGGSEITISAGGALGLGNYGVTLLLSTAEQYVKGDIFLIDVTASGKGAVKTLILADKLVGGVTTDGLTVTQGLAATFLLNDSEWTASAAAIVVAAAAQESGTYIGSSRSFDILSGALYMDYRELLLTNTGAVGSLDSVSDVVETLGVIHPENPLAMMVNTALSGSNGTDVYYIALEGTDSSDYSTALDHLTEISQSYSLVPHDTSREVADLIETHVDELSSPDNALFRMFWRGLDIQRLSSVYDALASGSSVLSTVTGTQLLATGATFVTAGVAAGDTVRINYHQDGVGNVIYDTYVVDAVTAEDELKLLTGPSSPITEAIKTEIWHNASLTEYAASISAEAVHHSNRRVTAVWSEPMSIGGFEDLSNTYLAALLAGVRSSGAPHQPMSLMEVPYVTMDVQTNFGTQQLNSMAGSGVWLVVQDVDGTIYTRNQVTTDPTDVFTREQTITTNLDHISRDYKSAVSDLYGRGNVSESMLRLIEARVDSTTGSIMGRSYSDIIGPQMTGLKITKLEVDAVLRDQVWLEMDVDLPVPMNHLVLKFRLI